MSFDLSHFFSNDYCKSLKISDWAYFEESSSISFDHYEKWIEEKSPEILKYLEGENKTKRKDLTFFYPEFKSGIVFLFDYSNEKVVLENILKKHENNLKLSSYVFGFEGEDYHHYLKRNLNLIAQKISEKFNESGLEFSLTLDIHPALERDIAYRSGLGWFGKNSMFISKKHGSFFIIGSLLFNKKMKNNYLKQPFEDDHCGNCTKCIESCPTDAISISNRTINASKCISTYTIELYKDELPPKGYPDSDKNIFGCDICQDVCPWNKKSLSIKNESTSFNNQMSNDIVNFFIKDSINSVKTKVDSMSGREFRKKFKNTPLDRFGKNGILKNINLF